MATYMNRNGWNLRREGCIEVWLYHGTEFVARIKYFKASAQAARFAKFLTQNLPPRNTSCCEPKGMHPLPILKTKGYTEW